MKIHLQVSKLALAVMSLPLTLSAGYSVADNRFDSQGGAVEGLGSFGSGSVTVHHNLLEAERQELVDMVNRLESRLSQQFTSEIDSLKTELDLTRDALAGDIDAVNTKTDSARKAAESAQDSADKAFAHADALYQQLDEVEQEVVATQLAVQQAQRAADDAQTSADLAQAEAAVAQASANAAEALARLARTEAATAQNTADDASDDAADAQATANAAEALARLARTEAAAAQNTADGASDDAADAQGAADAAAVLARQGIQDALEAYRQAEKAQQLASAAGNTADMAYALAQEAYAIGVPSGAYSYFHQTTCPTGWVHADGRNDTVDLRGEFIRTWDAGRNRDSGRTVRSHQQDTVSFPAPIYHMNHGFGPAGTMDGFGDMPTPISFIVTDDAIGYRNGIQSDEFYGYSERASEFEKPETRPSNVALLACKKQ